MRNLAYYNGKIDVAERLTVPFCDRACFFGDGVYDACYARNGRVFTLEEHIDRLFASADAADIVIPLSSEDLTRAICSLVKESRITDAFVYFQVSRGTQIRNHLYEKTPGNLWILVTEKKITDKNKTYKLVSAPDRRYRFCNIKTLNLLPNVIAANRATEFDADETVFHEDGLVTECAHSNVHLLVDGVLRSPGACDKILGGIARKHLIAACKNLSIAVSEKRFTYDDMLTADEIIVTSAGTLCARAASLDGIRVGNKDEERFSLLSDYLYGEFYAKTL